MTGERPPFEVDLHVPLTWRAASHRPGSVDLDEVEAVARQLLVAVLPRLPDAPGGERGRVQQKVLDVLRGALASRWGGWIDGWCRGQAQDGGPIRAWCCNCNVTTVGETGEKVRAAVAEWQGWLEHLERRFAELRHGRAGVGEEEALSRAAAALIHEVAERTEVCGAWYVTAYDVLAWFAESLGMTPERARQLALSVADGRFESWSDPDVEETSEVSRALAQALVSAPVEDALELWAATRAKVDWDEVPLLDVATLPPHRGLPATSRPWRDDAKRERFERAHARVRADARIGAPLAWERLLEWQAELLGAPAAFRRGPAFAKGGLERYGLAGDTEARYRAALAEASAPSPALPARAARLYLDTCFFHPFPDGNARAASLLLERLLLQEGVVLADGRPVFRTPRWADDVNGARLLAASITRLARRLED